MFTNITIDADGNKLILKNLKEFNLILGRNGCGKSRLLRYIKVDLEKQRV